jgi:hypothetical protein
MADERDPRLHAAGRRSLPVQGVFPVAAAAPACAVGDGQSIEVGGLQRHDLDRLSDGLPVHALRNADLALQRSGDRGFDRLRRRMGVDAGCVLQHQGRREKHQRRRCADRQAAHVVDREILDRAQHAAPATEAGLRDPLDGNAADPALETPAASHRPHP